jgi:hypothetical protein
VHMPLALHVDCGWAWVVLAQLAAMHCVPDA